jgi:hypothetical protein
MDKMIRINFVLPLAILLFLLLPAGIQHHGGPKALASEGQSDQSISIHLPLVAGGAGSGQVFIENPFGVEVKPLSDLPGLQEIADAGSSFTRLNGVLWANVEPVEGARNWGALAGKENQLKKAAEHGLRVVLVVRHTPAWAQKVPGYFCGSIKPSKLAAFANFMKDLVSRYSAAPYHVKYWELYNEPDISPGIVPKSTSAFGCWGDASDPYYGGGYYAEMLEVVYPKIKEADPDAKVLIGGVLLSCNPATGKCSSDEEALASKFLEGILVNQGGNSFDGVAFHNYDIFMYQLGAYWSRKWESTWDDTGPALIAKAHFIKNMLETYNVFGKFLMNSETALLCGASGDPPGSPGCEAAADSDYELTKAYYITESYVAAIAEGLRANIWYSHLGWRNSGLLYTDAYPRPAMFAYRFARQMLSDATYLGSIVDQDTGGVGGLQGYKFQGPYGELIWVIWARNRASNEVVPASPPDAVWDVFGNPISLPTPTKLSITLAPSYVAWNP